MYSLLMYVCVVAVSAFKAAIILELNRRENDQKVITLNATMCDMMQVMTLSVKSPLPERYAHTPCSLKDVVAKDQGDDGMTIEHRLQGRMGGIIDSIKRCAKLSDSYQKRHTAGKCWSSCPQLGAKALGTVKFFTSIKWKPKFEDVAEQFAAHKRDLLSDLQFHASITATKTHQLLVSVDEKIASMKAMIDIAFEKMQTPDERELASFAQMNGGPERVLENGMLLKKILDKQKIATKDDKGPTSGKGGAPTQTALTVSELEKEILKDVDAILAENTGAFERKFGAIELSLKEVNVTIQRQSDRVISEVLAGMHAGPHERIKDRVGVPGL